MEILLSNMKIGQKGIVKILKVEGPIKRRLFDMGITPGADIIMVKRAPLGGPIEITIRGYQLSLRKSEAINIIIEVNNNENCFGR